MPNNRALPFGPVFYGGEYSILVKLRKKSLIAVYVHFVQDRQREIYRSGGGGPLAGLQQN